MIIAIDGPSGAGKSSTAKATAQRLGFLYIDTGAMYRAVTLAALGEQIPYDAPNLDALLDSYTVDLHHIDGQLHVILNDRDVTALIRSHEVTQNVSAVSAVRIVRERMVEAQRRIARNFVSQGGGVILDGRDIGTVVFPNADLKIFLNADAEERARRRQRELVEKGIETPFQDVLNAMVERDRKDSVRAIAPLKQAEDAIVIDTTGLSLDEQVEQVVRLAMQHGT